jgi:DNA polymerase-3 subunit alpha
VQDHGLPEQKRLNEQLFKLAPEVGLPLVLTNDLHYVKATQQEAHDVLLCIGTASNLETPNRMRFNSGDFYLKSPAQMAALFPDRPELLRNTRVISDAVDFNLPLGQLRMPDVEVPKGESVDSWLRKEAERGLARRYGTASTAARERMEYELGVILKMGYGAYFLIVADFVRFAREQGIATTCRGSAPGSIVTYALGITPVDPLHYDLPFERFLNEDRVTMPDMTLKMDDEKR